MREPVEKTKTNDLNFIFTPDDFFVDRRETALSQGEESWEKTFAEDKFSELYHLIFGAKDGALFDAG